MTKNNQLDQLNFLNYTGENTMNTIAFKFKDSYANNQIQKKEKPQTDNPGLSMYFKSVYLKLMSLEKTMSLTKTYLFIRSLTDQVNDFFLKTVTPFLGTQPMKGAY